jgi:membrane protease YdiL (CAAX protease family)
MPDRAPDIGITRDAQQPSLDPLLDPGKRVMARTRKTRPVYSPPATGWWRWVLRAIAIVLAIGLLAEYINNGLTGLSQILTPPAPAQHTSTPLGYYLVAYGRDAVVATIALTCLAIADGPRAVGLRPRLRATGHARVTGAVLMGPFLLSILALGVFTLLTSTWFRAVLANSGVPFQQAQPPLWLVIIVATLNAIAEEAVLLGVLLRALDYLPLGQGRTLGRYGWWAIALLAVLRMAYHIYQGVTVVPDLLPPAILFPIIYRRSGALVPIIIAHALIDIAGSLPLLAQDIFHVALGVTYLWWGKQTRIIATPVRPKDKLRRASTRAARHATAQPDPAI